MNRLRPPAVAGKFYPEDSNVLQKQVDSFLAKAVPQKVAGEVKALIVPHAGYIYSGQVAAHAYKLLEGRVYEAVVVVAPSHYVPFQGASLYKGDAYKTPLGEVPIHQEISRGIFAAGEVIKFIPAAHGEEHSLEVQLPFLQTVLSGFELVPLVLGSQDLSTCRRTAKAIATALRGRNALLVASSDLSHYHPYSRALELDRVVQGYVTDFDPKGLAEAVNRGECEACGAGPIVTVMLAARELGADKARVLHYANSGDVSGNRGQVVGYMSAALYGSKGELKGKEALRREEEEEFRLSAADKELLREVARASIVSEVTGTPFPSFEILSPILHEKRGGFVTIKKGGYLRGCIGYIRAYKPLYQTVREMARAAALEDPRFSPVTAQELPELELEISVLTPLLRAGDPKEVVVGRHGIYIRRGFKSGLLLPQVATENRWDRTAFLRQTCLKAGLSPNAWQEEGTEIYLFSADIF